MVDLVGTVIEGLERLGVEQGLTKKLKVWSLSGMTA